MLPGYGRFLGHKITTTTETLVVNQDALAFVRAERRPPSNFMLPGYGRFLGHKITTTTETLVVNQAALAFVSAERRSIMRGSEEGVSAIRPTGHIGRAGSAGRTSYKIIPTTTAHNYGRCWHRSEMLKATPRSV
jgi:hypothetical protein